MLDTDAGARMHADHCIEALRISIMCQGDTTAFFTVVDPGAPADAEGDFSPQRRCRDLAGCASGRWRTRWRTRGRRTGRDVQGNTEWDLIVRRGWCVGVGVVRIFYCFRSSSDPYTLPCPFRGPRYGALQAFLREDSLKSRLQTHLQGIAQVTFGEHPRQLQIRRALNPSDVPYLLHKLP